MSSKARNRSRNRDRRKHDRMIQWMLGKLGIRNVKIMQACRLIARHYGMILTTGTKAEARKVIADAINLREFGKQPQPESEPKSKKVRTIVVSEDGPPCPRCYRVMQIREHSHIGAKQLKQPFYYARWYRCMHRDCRTTLVMPKEHIVWNDHVSLRTEPLEPGTVLWNDATTWDDLDDSKPN